MYCDLQHERSLTTERADKKAIHFPKRRYAIKAVSPPTLALDATRLSADSSHPCACSKRVLYGGTALLCACNELVKQTDRSGGRGRVCRPGLAQHHKKYSPWASIGLSWDRASLGVGGGAGRRGACERTWRGLRRAAGGPSGVARRTSRRLPKLFCRAPGLRLYLLWRRGRPFGAGE